LVRSLEDWLGTPLCHRCSSGRGRLVPTEAAQRALPAVLQAAIDGHGVALARSVMARDDLVAGRLVRLFPETTFASALAYYVVYRPECGMLPKLVAFRAWLVGEASTV
jgi:LysR family transcriptional regulator, glycine cleavage system transcriptional activator